MNKLNNIIKSFVVLTFILMLGCFIPANAVESMDSIAAIDNQSLIERIFPAGLKQIGYDFFQNFQAPGAGKYDGDYTLNIGEKVNIYCWGDSVNVMALSGNSLISPVINAQIDTKGDLFIPGIGVVKAEGKTIKEVEENIQSIANKKFSSLNVRLNVADSSDFAIFVYGYVNKPGKIAISNNSTMIEVLAAAGGVNKNGSLRNITYKSGEKTQTVDLYDVIFNGKSSNLNITPNDSIFVNNIGGVVAIKNGVKIPGIYEIKAEESVEQAISFAGGILPSTSDKTINIKTYDKDRGQRFSRDISAQEFKSTKLANGDIIEFSNLFGAADNFISLIGNVKHPGIFEYKEGMKLSDVLPNKNELQDESLLHQAVIKRISPIDKQVKTIPVSLKDFFEGGNNPNLEPKDTIKVFSSTSASFIEVYGCINRPKNMPYNTKLTLKDVLTDVQFMASSSDIKNNEKDINLKENKKEKDIVVNIITSNDNMVIPADNIAVEITNGKDPSKLDTYYLLDILVKNDSTKYIRIEPYDKILFRTLRDNEIIKTVKVSGYVKHPSVYSFIKGKRLTDMIEMAGGLKDDANFKGIVFKRESLASRLITISAKKDKKDMDLIKGQMLRDKNLTLQGVKSQEYLLDTIKTNATESPLKQEFDGRIVLNIKHNDITKIEDSENIEIQDGDEIYIPKTDAYVSVMGEVYNESSFVYQPKKKANYYIDLVGGYTPNAKKNEIYKVSSDGKAYKLKNLSAKIEPGDTIIIPRRIRGNDWLNTVMKSMQTIASTLASVFILTKI